MMHRLRYAAAVAALAIAAAPSGASGQTRDERYEHWSRPVLRIGQDYTLRAGAVVEEALVIAGDATIDGAVDHDLVVVLGKAHITKTAVIDGSLVVAGGSAFIDPEALVRGDLIVVGGALESPAGFFPGGQQVVIGTQALGGTLEAFAPWITRGLLWGRPIVPQLQWVWVVVGIVFVVYLIVGAFAHRPVHDATEKLSEKPLTTFGAGLLVLLLTGPVCLLLTVSVIGIAVVPFVLCALFVGWIIGKVGVMRWIGRTLLPESSEGRGQAIRSFVIGFGALCVVYMIPLLGFIAWTLVGVFGLGAASLAFIAAYRQENPAPPPRAQPEPPRPAAPPPPAPPTPPLVPAAPDLASGAATSAFDLPPPAPATELGSFPHAPFQDRLAAFVLDVVLVVFVQQVLDLTHRDSGVFLLLLAYHIGFWTWKGTTVGGIICQLRVIRTDGTLVRFADALVRGLASIFSLVVLGIGALWILRDPERQAWHDKIAGTYVVKVPRNWPL